VLACAQDFGFCRQLNVDEKAGPSTPHMEKAEHTGLYERPDKQVLGFGLEDLGANRRPANSMAKHQTGACL